MRLSTNLLFGLTILGICSGCTVFGNPLARTDPAEVARERQAAEISALIARGDYEGAQRLMDAARTDGTPPVQSVFGQTHTLASEADRERMIDQLLAGQPAEYRPMLRQKYAQLSSSRLEELVAMSNELRGIGQSAVPESSVPTLVQEPSIQLAGNQQRPGQNGGVTQAQSSAPGRQQPAGTPSDGFGIGFPSLQNTGELHAPDPRPQGATAAPLSPTGAAPRLPDGIDARVSQAGHLGTAGPGVIQPVSGTQPHTSAYPTGAQAAGLYGAGSDSHPFAGLNRSSDGGPLPVITPGNAEPLAAGAQHSDVNHNLFGNLPAGQYGSQGTIQPTSGYAAQPPVSRGAATLENRIEVGEGTISGSATTQLGATAAGGSFPMFGQQSPTGAGAPTNLLPPTGDPATGQSSDPSLIPGVVRGRYESIRNATASVTERGLRTFGAIGSDEAAVPAMGPGYGAATQPATIDGLIAAIEADLARTAPGDTETERLAHVRRQVNLRMLYLIADRIDQSIEPITGTEPADQEFWQQLFFAYVNYFDAQQMPQASDRATQTIDQLRAAIGKLRHRADLKLKNVTFCHHIVSFGDYERFSTDQFTPGQPLLLYAEVENFFSTRTDTDRYRTVLQSQIELYDNSNMQRPVITIPFDASEDQCRNHRRDFFHSYEFTVPQELKPGLYTLVLRVTDQLSQKVATSRLNFSVE